MPQIDDDKKAARKLAFAARAEAHGTGRDAAAQAHLTAVLGQMSTAPLSGYLPIRTEIDPVPVMAAHLGPVGVPIVLGEGQPLEFHLWTPDCALKEGPFGAKVPVDGVEMTPQVVIVPLAAFDARGFRLGYGGGFYDRTLAKLKAQGPVRALGFAYDAQELPEVPIDEFDQPLDGIVTESGLRLF